MSARRYVVRRLPGYRTGDKRWVVWDTHRQEWADDAHTTRRDAEDVRDELNADATTGAIEPPVRERAPTKPHGRTETSGGRRKPANTYRAQPPDTAPTQAPTRVTCASRPTGHDLTTSANEAWIKSTPPHQEGAHHLMTTTQRPPIGRADTAPTAAQKVVAAMWTLGRPATPKAIAEAAGVGYSTVTPILRNLLADNQAVKTDSDTGPAEWQLTATLPTPAPAPTEDEAQAQAPTATNPDSGPPPTTSGTDTNQPDHPRPDDTPDTGEPSAPDTGAEPALDTQSGNDDGSDTDTDGEPEPDTAAADLTTPQAPADAEQQPTTRTYRKPVQPRRPKGELRAAVLAVLQRAPDQPFKVSEICKVIDAANTDGSSNKAGAGAVANALDKLVTSGDAIRVEDAKYATYQAATGG